jgi:hypothetical protein
MATGPAQQVQESRQIQRVLQGVDASLDHKDEGPLEASVRGDRATRLTQPNWSRMRRSWNAEDRYAIDEIMAATDKIIRDTFPVAFALMDKIYRAARFAKADKATGLKLTGPEGGPVWEMDQDGLPVEDWTRIGDKDRDDWLWIITTHLFEWEQQQARMWGTSMYAKGKWEEVFSNAFQSGNAGSTVDDKTQYGQSSAMESRYFAIFQGLLSRRSDALVRSMARIQGVLERNAR